MKALLAAQHLRREDDDYTLPMSRRKNRLFEEGRTKPLKATAIVLDQNVYDPVSDVHIWWFVRRCVPGAAGRGAEH